jgi:inosine-uridine nucleoside N-ribohydrolase
VAGIPLILDCDPGHDDGLEIDRGRLIDLVVDAVGSFA